MPLVVEIHPKIGYFWPFYAVECSVGRNFIAAVEVAFSIVNLTF